MYRTIVKRAGVNPLTGKKQYKVKECFGFSFDTDVYIYYMGYSQVDTYKDCNEEVHMAMTTVKYHAPGTFINPRKAMAYAMTVDMVAHNVKPTELMNNKMVSIG